MGMTDVACFNVATYAPDPDNDIDLKADNLSSKLGSEPWPPPDQRYSMAMV
jgi:hypothetical protein